MATVEFKTNALVNLINDQLNANPDSDRRWRLDPRESEVVLEFAEATEPILPCSISCDLVIAGRSIPWTARLTGVEFVKSERRPTYMPWVWRATYEVVERDIG